MAIDSAEPTNEAFRIVLDNMSRQTEILSRYAGVNLQAETRSGVTYAQVIDDARSIAQLQLAFISSPLVYIGTERMRFWNSEWRRVIALAHSPTNKFGPLAHALRTRSLELWNSLGNKDHELYQQARALGILAQLLDSGY